MREVWPDSFVEESSLSHNIYLLRKALGEGEGEQTFIETVPRRGYRFVSAVREVADEGAGLVMQQRTRARILIEEEVTEDGAKEGDESRAGAPHPAPLPPRPAPGRKRRTGRSRPTDSSPSPSAA